MYSCCCVLSGGPGSSQTLSSLFWPSSFLPFISPPLPGSGERLRWIQPPGAAWVLQQGGFRSVDRSPACMAELICSVHTLYALCVSFLSFPCVVSPCLLDAVWQISSCFKTVCHLWGSFISLRSFQCLQKCMRVRSTSLCATSQPRFSLFQLEIMQGQLDSLTWCAALATYVPPYHYSPTTNTYFFTSPLARLWYVKNGLSLSILKVHFSNSLRP